MREIKNSIDIVHIVVIQDFKDYIAQQQIDSVWYNWEDAVKRVKELNEDFDSDDYCDCHAHYFQKVVE